MLFKDLSQQNFKPLALLLLSLKQVHVPLLISVDLLLLIFDTSFEFFLVLFAHKFNTLHIIEFNFSFLVHETLVLVASLNLLCLNFVVQFIDFLLLLITLGFGIYLGHFFVSFDFLLVVLNIMQSFFVFSSLNKQDAGVLNRG